MAEPRMRVWAASQRGSPNEVLRLRELPRPQESDLQPHEILLKITHAGIFQGTAKIMSLLPRVTSDPWIPEIDCCGIVLAVGSSVTNLAPGDEVFGGPDPKRFLFDKRYNGALAEYAIFPSDIFVKRPENLSSEAAAAVTANGCTAVQIVIEQAKLRPGDKVLITGGSGGLGSLLVQVAKAAVGDQGKVWATCSGANTDLVKSLGADGVVDYTQHAKLHEHLAKEHHQEPFDALIDVVGTEIDLYDNCPAFLKKDGVFIWCGKINATHGSEVFSFITSLIHIQLKTIWPAWLGGTPRKGIFYSSHLDGSSMQKVADLVKEGKVIGLTDSVWEMEDVLKAYQRAASMRSRGKVIVHIQDS